MTVRFPFPQRNQDASSWGEALVRLLQFEWNKLSARVAANINIADFPFDFGAGSPTASQELAILLSREIILPADFSLSVGIVTTNPASNLVIDINRGSTLIGTATVSSAGVWVFSASTPGVDIHFPVGSLLRVIMPGVIPGGVTGVRLTLAGTIA